MSVLKRRTYVPADQRREQILDCALEVFAGRGFFAVSIADICNRAGIARGTLYQYFTDKRDVLMALVDRIVERVIEASQRVPEPELAADDLPSIEVALAAIEHACEQILAAAFADERATRFILRAVRGCDGVVDDALRRVDDHVLQLIEGHIRQAAEIGAIQPCDPALVARLFLGGLEKIVMAALDAGRPLDVQHVARESSRLLALGLFLRRSPAGPDADSATGGGPPPELRR